jgi:hypothetical protein
LYHATFPSAYLKQIHDTGNVDNDSPGVTLKSTKLYDFCVPGQRAEWLDILVALIEYIRSGESRIGFVNKAMANNMLHKTEEDNTVAESTEIGKDTIVGDSDAQGLKRSDTLRRSSRKRGLNVTETESRDTKLHRKI